MSYCLQAGVYAQNSAGESSVQGAHEMNLAVLAISFIALLAIAYRFYGAWVARQFGIDDSRQTPANKINDGVDYVPTRPFYLFGQHFSAIAAAGPIAGPILAAQNWGWFPSLIWIAFGVIFIGAVHDFSSLTASVRHQARSVSEITREYLGGRAGHAMLLFIWIVLIYVTIAFTQITAGTFVSATEELQAAGQLRFNPGGAVAAASIFYLTLSIIMGFVQRYLKPPLWLVTVIFVPAALGTSWLGTYASTLFVADARTWGLLIVGYCCVASMLPVWALLQPRGYLGGFILYLALGLGVIGVLFGGYEIQQPAFRSWDIGGMTGTLFPFLFVTIACGACSGFHGLVCSGTTSKQVARESHCRPVGYGAMLAEAFVALIAMVTIMIMTADQAKGLSAGTIYGNGIGRFLTLLIGEQNLAIAITFGAMAFSTFVFDTLDVGTRLGRYIMQELFGWKGAVGMIGGTLLTMALPFYVIATADMASYNNFWVLFGASNQLLAALTLLSITVWLSNRRQKFGFTLFPMIFVLVMTLWALSKLALTNFQNMQGLDIRFVNGLASSALVLLALYLAVTAVFKLRMERGRPMMPASSSSAGD
jgi:carbon starvation protein